MIIYEIFFEKIIRKKFIVSDNYLYVWLRGFNIRKKIRPSFDLKIKENLPFNFCQFFHFDVYLLSNLNFFNFGNYRSSDCVLQCIHF